MLLAAVRAAKLIVMYLAYIYIFVRRRGPISPKSRPWTHGSYQHPWTRDAILISIGSNGPFGTECRRGRSGIRRFCYSKTVAITSCAGLEGPQFLVWLVCGSGVASRRRKPHRAYSVLGGSVTLLACGCTGRRPVLVQEQNAGLWGVSIARV